MDLSKTVYGPMLVCMSCVGEFNTDYNTEYRMGTLKTINPDLTESKALSLFTSGAVIWRHPRAATLAESSVAGCFGSRSHIHPVYPGVSRRILQSCSGLPLRRSLPQLSDQCVQHTLCCRCVVFTPYRVQHSDQHPGRCQGRTLQCETHLAWLI